MTGRHVSAVLSMIAAIGLGACQEGGDPEQAELQALLHDGDLSSLLGRGNVGAAASAVAIAPPPDAPPPFPGAPDAGPVMPPPDAFPMPRTDAPPFPTSDGDPFPDGGASD